MQRDKYVRLKEISTCSVEMAALRGDISFRYLKPFFLVVTMILLSCSMIIYIFTDERRPTVNELSNQRGVIQKASGWKLYHMAAQMEDLVSFIY
jgi:hypothetical protein